MPRPTIQDVAREAGVSPATVDRVLNARLPVKPETAKRVAEAASALGYHAAGLIAQRLDRDVPLLRLGFLLLKGSRFYRQLAQLITETAAAARDYRITVLIEHVGDTSPAHLAERMRALGERCQVLAVVSVDHPLIAVAVADLKERGVPVFALLSDFATDLRAGYVGIDNLKAGRTAGWLIARTARQTGKVGIMVGSHRFHGHELREMGLRSYFRENAPDFEVLDSRVNLEEPSIAYETTFGLLRRYPDLVGLYVAGGGMEGVITALREEGRKGLIAICPELTTDSHLALTEEVITYVIGTPLAQLPAELIRVMALACLVGSADVPSQSFLPFTLYLPENI
ncbi:LacI family transcriptional regulator [Labrys miyagiensis]|uniref:LacI family transcriptional regulator n=1 Tax=Labrys miyagiensis TaxID=346912 RepID=A0ABQ6CL81_9HYPH|nr:LacI family DNA-binding transcriptional regulator [Labrys miyagiensis]GLS19484.1 LacI family transcriptional regulator [Labrys miyagiensis]